MLEISYARPIHVDWGGLLVSRGIGGHAERIIDSFELIFVQAGELSMQEEDKVYTMKQGESLLLWPGRRHCGTQPYPEDLQFFWVHFKIPNIALLDEDKSVLKLPQHAVVKRPDFLAELFRRYLDVQMISGNNNPTAQTLVWLMLCEVADQDVDTSTVKAAAIIAGRAYTFIKRHFHEHLSVQYIADQMPCSSKYLSRIYHQTYGMTLTEAVHQMRIDHARTLLLNTNQSVSQIAAACGFTDVSYFLKLFKRHVGSTALSFRRLRARGHVITE
jgi:AraC-like DNA-binding protein